MVALNLAHRAIQGRTAAVAAMLRAYDELVSLGGMRAQKKRLFIKDEHPESSLFFCWRACLVCVSRFRLLGAPPIETHIPHPTPTFFPNVLFAGTPAEGDAVKQRLSALASLQAQAYAPAKLQAASMLDKESVNKAPQRSRPSRVVVVWLDSGVLVFVGRAPAFFCACLGACVPACA